MDTKTTILIKTDKQIKKVAQDFAHDIGIPLSTLINAYLRQLAIEKRVTFVSPQIPNAITRQAIQNARAKKNLTSYDSVDIFFNDILGDQWRTNQ
ncbi:type II toxin-antitoxin system RelB/DinJ family antitoxin [Candidatus Azambacteria bacterium]|nr:type II toxin-antitoxin system RelB/DinJ family antitoxin [Candidatus Azambacteria bacterium]